jgi:hypothetical protein
MAYQKPLYGRVFDRLSVFSACRFVEKRFTNHSVVMIIGGNRIDLNLDPAIRFSWQANPRRPQFLTGQEKRPNDPPQI